MNDNNLEDYKLWEINSPAMYNLAKTHILDWPSLTCQWLPSEEKDGCHMNKLILGTHADGEENQLIIAQYTIEKNSSDDLPQSMSANNLRFPLTGNFEIIKSFGHKGDVNRARYMPQNTSIIATRSSENECFIYNEEKCLLTLKGHSEEGYGLSWNKHVEGRLVTGSFDQTICSWDISRSQDGLVTPLRILKGHTDKVEDVCYHPLLPDVLASVGDDQRLMIWDERDGVTAPQLRTIAHSNDANCVQWHPIRDHLLLTGGSDGFVYLWDRRKLVDNLHSFETEESGVYRLAWSPLQETLFVSAGLGHQVHVWDVARIGDDVLSCDEEEKCPPELIMVHGGHKDAVSDLDWHPSLRSTLVSVAEDNALSVWQMKRSIVEEEEY